MTETTTSDITTTPAPNADTASSPAGPAGPTVTVPRTGGQLIVDQLEAEGVTAAFCVPGESYLGVLDALHDSTVRTVVCRQEGGAAYMASAHARMTGGVGVAMVTRGPGAANAMVALHAAHQDSVPLVLFVGLIPRTETYRDAFQEFDLRAWFGSTTKEVLHVEHAERAAELVSRAFTTARSGKPGPVVVGLPEDMQADPVHATARPRTRVEVPVPAPDVLHRFTDRIAAARAPLVVLGGGGWTPTASRQVQAWAEANELPVTVEFNALDLIDQDSPSYAGNSGYGHSAATGRAWREADLVIGIGSPLGDVVTDSWTLLDAEHPHAEIITVVPDAEGLGSAHAGAWRIVSPVAGFAAVLADQPAAGDRPWAARTRELHAAFEATGRPEPAGTALDLNVVFGQLAGRLERDAVVTWGAGNHAGWAGRYLRWHGYPSLLATRNGSMGYSVPAAVAAAVAAPGRRVLAVAGDGDFLMNGQELAVAVAQGVAPVVIVVNNGMYGTIRTHQELHHPARVSGTELVNPDFAAYARAFGGHGETVTVTDQFLPALERALAAGVPAVIELQATEGQLMPDATIADIRAAGTARQANATGAG